MLPITGYSDHLSVCSGQKLKFFVHSEEKTYAAQLVRVRCGDINPEGPGLKEEKIDSKINGTYEGKKQKIYAGSFVEVPMSAKQHVGFKTLEQGFSFTVYIYPTLIGKDQVLFDLFDRGKKQGLFLRQTKKGLLEATIGTEDKVSTLVTTNPLTSHLWYAVSFTFREGCYVLEQVALDKYHKHLSQQVLLPLKNQVVFPHRAIMIGGEYHKLPSGRIVGKDTWNGKIDSPSLIDAKKEKMVSWNFSLDIPSIKVTDEGKLQFHGRIENLPTRGVTGYKYQGEHTSWVSHPEYYSAIHFHDDDVYDAKWEESFSLQISEELKSGLYAVKLTAASQDEYLPFVVRPAPGQKRNKLALLFPTATYMAYANEHMMMDPPIGELICQRAIQISPYQEFLKEHREYGNSLYDVHSDGSGVHYSSRLRPILNMRPKRLFGIGGGSSFLWQFNADTHILDWLEEGKIEYDIITDEDIESRGVEELKEYKVVMTTTHPEYYSTNMFKALEDYIDNSGRLMYMGGNGFYWRVAFHSEIPGVIEVRRTAGTRAWETAPGEGTHSFTGEAGGLWRYHNHSPNSLCGVGFAAQGFDKSSHYVKTKEADNPRVSFMFEGVKDTVLGDFGLIGGGAAGMEIDRYDPYLGSPRHALVVASSQMHSAAHVVAVEDIFNNYLGVDGEQNSLVRADLTFFETPSGGAVFSTGSISWSGALSHNTYQNNISKITGNVLRRFLDQEPFVYPQKLKREAPLEDEENPHNQLGC